jgi:hypothetical protein
MARNLPFSKGMKDNSFAMDTVGFIDKKEVERLKQEPEEHRRRTFRCFQGAIALFMLATIVVFTYSCRAELQFLFFTKPATQTGNEASLASSAGQGNPPSHEVALNDTTK